MKQNTEQFLAKPKQNAPSEKGKAENQNQTHNVKKEGITPVNQKR